MSSTYSLELARLALALNEPECEPSPFARSIPIAAPSSANDGRECPATTTCELSPPLTSPQMAFELTLCAADSHVRTSASPASEPVWPASEAASGAITPDLLVSFDPHTSSWKT